MSILVNFFASFGLGLLTPLTAVCVLPLYPAFLAYLANRFSGKNEKANRKYYAMFGFLITIGVIIFMFLFGILFTTLFQTSLTNAISIISPIAFGILAIISFLLIFDVDIGKFVPRAKIPTSEHPVLNSLLYGFFFGAIILPCNPGFITAFLARAVLIQNPTTSILNFVFFGFGIGFPLLTFSLLSSSWSQKIIGFATKNKRVINVLTGIIMLGISLYYLIFVFRVF